MPDPTRPLLDPLLAAFHARLQAELEGELTDIYLSGQAQMVTWGKTAGGIPIAYEGPPMQAAIDWAKDHCATLVTRMDEETKSRLAQVIADGIANKRGPGGLATDIKRELGWMGRGKPSAIKGLTQQGRAYMIARTESANALSQASLEAMKDMGIEGKEWVATADACDICRMNADAGVIPVGDAFPSGDMAPTAHPRCLLPGVRVEATEVIAGSRAFYRGKAVEVCAENGHRLTTTPNHMILTPSGFVPAESLREGDYVMCCSDSQRMAPSVNPHHDQGPSPVSEIWNALVMQPGMMLSRVPVAAEHFHSDGRSCYGDVDIVWPDSLLLGDAGDSGFGKQLAQQALDGRDSEPLGLSRGSSPLPFSDGLTPASCGNVSGGGACLALLGRKAVHVQGSSFPVAANAYPSINEALAETRTADTALARELLLGFTGYITAQKVVEVRYFDYSGHVYDLQTAKRWYIANSIVTHNCECALAPARLK